MTNMRNDEETVKIFSTLIEKRLIFDQVVSGTPFVFGGHVILCHQDKRRKSKKDPDSFKHIDVNTIKENIFLKRYQTQLTRDEWMSRTNSDVLFEKNYKHTLFYIFTIDGEFIECLIKINNKVSRLKKILNILKLSKKDWYISPSSIWITDRSIKFVLDLLTS